VLSLVITLSAVPCLAAAAIALPLSAGAGSGVAFSAAAGAAAGALAAQVAVPDSVTLAVAVLLTVAAALAWTLTALHASVTASAAVVVILARALLAEAPRAAAALERASARLRHWTGAPQPAGLAFTRTLRLLTLLTVAAAAVLLAWLPVLARSPDAFATGLALAVAIALLTRAVQAESDWQVAVAAIPALAGLLAAAAALPARLPGATWVWPALVAAGLMIVVAGTVAAVTRSPLPGHDHRLTRLLLGSAFVVSNLVTLPLAFGALGAFHQMMLIGRHP
jgi:hypothetical protein